MPAKRLRFERHPLRLLRQMAARESRGIEPPDLRWFSPYSADVVRRLMLEGLLVCSQTGDITMTQAGRDAIGNGTAAAQRQHHNAKISTQTNAKRKPKKPHARKATPARA